MFQGYLLRILCKIPGQELTALNFIMHQLQNARFRGLKDVIHCLMLVQIAFEHSTTSLKAGLNSHHESLNSVSKKYFCPEIVHVITQMFALAVPVSDSGENCKGPNILALRDSMLNCSP